MANPITSGQQPVVAPNMSGFDKSFKNLLTAKVGTLVPVLCDPVVAGTRVNLRHALQATMPPLASDTYMNVDVKLESFFVPASSLYGGFNDFITKRDVYNPVQGAYKKAILPYIDLSEIAFGEVAGQREACFGPGSLADYLGMRDLAMVPASQDLQYLPHLNPFPFLAYHRVWDRFYRNSLVTKPIFSRAGDHPTSYGDWINSISFLPYQCFTEGDEVMAAISEGATGSIGSYTSAGFLNDIMYKNGRDCIENFGLPSLFCLRQRNFGADYFTTCTPTPQKGNPSTINFKVDATSLEGEVSIAAFRAANAVQLFRERNNYCDDNIHSYNRAHYGVNRTGYGESLPVFLGQSVVNVYTNGVAQTGSVIQGSTSNPFNSVATQYGNANASGRGDLIDGFEAPEFGYVMVLASLVPTVAYSSGVERHMLELVNGNGVGDIPDALLQQVGPQEVFEFELYGDKLGAVSPSNPDGWRGVFGYQQRFANYMEKRDQVHGKFIDGQSLDAFALQRSFTAASLNTDFLMIPTTYLDQVAAVAAQISQFGYWMDIFFDYKVSMPLAAYSIPSLENPDGHTEWVARPGYTIH